MIIYYGYWQINLSQGRYEIMRNYMPKVGSLGLDMMFRTCTVQVSRNVELSCCGTAWCLFVTILYLKH